MAVGVSATHVAKWDGMAWSALGSGVSSGRYDCSVYALASDGSSLYAGGAFTTADGVTANNIAKWDGTDWSTLASGVSTGSSQAVVGAFAWDGITLYAGGEFTSAGGVAASCIAGWTGNEWTSMTSDGDGITGYVYALAWCGNNLYAGGWFTSAGGVAANNVAMWDGTAWHALGDGTNGRVQALAWDGSNLYAGGAFTTAGGMTAICAGDGTA
jgi:hypothetical protein